MIWATVSSRSCFCWRYRASSSLAPKNIINLISVLAIWWCHVHSLLLRCWKIMFVMTSAFPSQNSIILCPASFCTPRSHLPIPLLLLTLDMGCLLTATTAVLGHWVSPHSRRCWHWMWGVSFGCSPLQGMQQLLTLRKVQPPQIDWESSVQTCFLSFKVPSPLYCLQWCSVHH